MFTPFIHSFLQADLLGKLIYLALALLSVVTWAVILQKAKSTRQARKESLLFKKKFAKQKNSPLNIEMKGELRAAPLLAIYNTIKEKTLELLGKNRHFRNESILSGADINYIDTHAEAAIAQQTRAMSQHLYLLSTCATLAPFLGLLGTVWGILVSFSQMQAGGDLASSSAVLNGLALALTTTVLGLIVAIPALIGYNYYRAEIGELDEEMHAFSSEVMATVELQYRQVDIHAQG